MAFSTQILLSPPLFFSSARASRSLGGSPLIAHPRHQGWASKPLCTSLLSNSSRINCSLEPRHTVRMESKLENPPIMPAVMTAAGPLELSSLLFQNRIIFIGQFVNADVAQRVISQLITLAAIDENADILIYLNCPGGVLYYVLGIYDCMSWIKPKVGTIAFGTVSSHGSLILAGGEKGMRYSMPNSRIMIHQPRTTTGGHILDIKRQVGETVHSLKKIDALYAAFTGQPLKEVQYHTDLDYFFSPAEALDFGLIDGILETDH